MDSGQRMLVIHLPFHSLTLSHLSSIAIISSGIRLVNADHQDALSVLVYKDLQMILCAYVNDAANDITSFRHQLRQNPAYFVQARLHEII